MIHDPVSNMRMMMFDVIHSMTSTIDGHSFLLMNGNDGQCYSIVVVADDARKSVMNSQTNDAAESMNQAYRVKPAS